METYRVKQEDLIGQLKGFPIEVVQRMVDCQVEQGNKADVSVFQKYNMSDDGTGGFWWAHTKEGPEFWWKVIALNVFDLFFDKYPIHYDKRVDILKRKLLIILRMIRQFRMNVLENIMNS